MVCYACRRAAENECGQCGRTYCGRHGAAVCAVCSSPASTAPSPLVFRTTVGASAALLLLAGVFLMWWPTAPAGERRTFLVSDIPAPPRPPTSSLEAAGGPTPSPTARAVTPTPQPPLTYTIVAGDTPGEIASRLGVSVDELLRANGIADPSLIQIGQQLKVPAPAAPSATATAPPAGVRTYTIAAGDTPLDIAARFGVTAEALLRANGITDPSLIQIGQVLTIPAPPGAPTAAPTMTATATPAPTGPAATPTAASASPTPTATPSPQPTPTATPTQAPSGSRTYTIVAGDTPIDIAARFGITVEELLRANGVTDPSLLQIGQVLTIPTPGAAAPTASPTPTPAATVTPAPQATPTPTSAAGGQRTYTIVAGDTPIDIAARFGVTVEALLRANGVTDPSLLQIGQVLTIPSPGAPTGSAPTATPTPAATATATPAPQVTSTPASGTARTYTIVAGDTPIDIAARFGITVEALLRANGVTDPSLLQIGQVLTIPAPTGTTAGPASPSPTQREHTVVPGDTLLGIAIRYGVDVDALLRLNGISNSSALQIGQKLKIP